MAIYGRRTDSSRMGSYEGEKSGGMSGMFDALGGAVERYRDANLNPAQEEQVEGPTGKVTPAKKAHYGEYVGPDFMKGKSMSEAFGNVRKYFGDRLNSMKKSQEPTTGDGNVANTTIQTADPSTVKATAEGTQEGANTMEAKMADYRSRDGGKGWDPSNEKWFDPSQAEKYGWVDGKWQDPVQQQRVTSGQVTDGTLFGLFDGIPISDGLPLDEDGNIKYKGGTGAHPLFGFEGLGDAWQGAKSLWGALTK